MALKSYTLDRKLWFRISAILFVALWVAFIIASLLSRDNPGQHGEVSVAEFIRSGVPFIIFTSMFYLLVALVLGWLIQSVFVVIKSRHKESKKHAA